MRRIHRYEIFLEKEREHPRFSSLTSIRGYSDLAKELKGRQDSPFDDDRDFIKLVTLSKRIGGKKAQFKITWHNTAAHGLVKRVKERSSFQSISEFNEFFKEVVNRILPDMLGKEIIANGKYAVYVKEYNFTLILGINFDNISKGIYEMAVVTIAPGRSEQDVVKIIEIV
jgi:hypothetical protein